MVILDIVLALAPFFPRFSTHSWHYAQGKACHGHDRHPLAAGLGFDSRIYALLKIGKQIWDISFAKPTNGVNMTLTYMPHASVCVVG